MTALDGVPALLGIAILGLATLAFKVVGPLAAGRVHLSEGASRAADLLPTALIASLVAVQTFDEGPLSAKVLGVLAAAVATALRAPFAVVVVVGAAVAASLRAAGLP